MKSYLIFHNSDKWDGGAYAFRYGFATKEAALAHGLNAEQYSGRKLPMDIIVQLAEFDSDTLKLNVLGKLNIPDTEQADTDVLEWILK